MPNLNFASELDDDELAEVARRCEDMIEEGREAKSSRGERVAEWLELFLSSPEKRGPVNHPWYGASNVFLPISRVNLRAHLAQRSDSMYSNTDLLRAIPIRAPADDVKQVTEFYAKHFYKRVVPLRKKGYDWSFDSVLNGCGVVKTRVREERLIRRSVKVSEPNIFSSAVEQLQTLFGPVLLPRLGRRRKSRRKRVQRRTFFEVERVPFDSLLVPADAEDGLQWPECRWVAQLSEISWEEAVSRTFMGWEIDEEELGAAFREADRSQEDRSFRESADLGLRPAESVEVAEVYCRMALPNRFRPRSVRHDDPRFADAQEELVVTYLPFLRKVVSVRPLDLVRTDGMRPFCEMRYIKVPGQFWGMGLIEHLYEQQMASNELFNQMVNYGKLSNLPYWFVQPGSDLDSLAEIEPGAVIEVQGTPTAPSRAGFDAGFFLNAINQIAAWSEKDSSITDTTLGVNPSRPNAVRTVRGQLLQSENSRRNISLTISHASDDHIKLFRLMHGLVRDNIDPEVVFNVLQGPPSESVWESRAVSRAAFDHGAGPDDALDFEYVLNPASDAEQAEAQERLQILSPFLQNIAQVNPGGVRLIVKDLYEATGGQDFDQIWPPEQVSTLPPGQGPPPAQGGPPQGLQGIAPASDFQVDLLQGGNGAGAQ